MGVSNWEIVSLGEIVYINPPRSLKKGGVVKKVAMENVTEHQRKIAAWTYEEFRGSGARFAQHDILLARITPSLENGKTAFVDVLAENETAYGSTEFIVLAAKENKTDPLFVYYLTRSPDFRQYAIKSMSGTSGRQRVPTDALEKYEVVLPPLPEQRRIARILGSLDDKIELNRRMNATLEAMARALYKSWFVDFDPVRAKMDGRPSGLSAELDALFPDNFVDSELGKIPAGWEVANLQSLAHVAIGGIWGEDERFSGAIPVKCLRGVDLEHLREAGIAEPPVRWVSETSHKKRILSNNDVLIAGSGAGPLGRPLWINEALKNMFGLPLVYSNFTKRLTAYSEADAIFLDQVLFEMRLSGEIWEYSTGTALPNLDINGLLLGKGIVLPTGELREAFKNFLIPIFEDLYSGRNLLLREIRDTLLPKLMQGELPTK